MSMGDGATEKILVIAQRSLKFNGKVYRRGEVFLSSKLAAKHFMLQRRVERKTRMELGHIEPDCDLSVQRQEGR